MTKDRSEINNKRNNNNNNNNNNSKNNNRSKDYLIGNLDQSKINNNSASSSGGSWKNNDLKNNNKLKKKSGNRKLLGKKDSKLKLPHPYLREFDFTDFVYTPHTLTGLIILVAMILFMIRYYYFPNMGIIASSKLGFAASALSIIVFGAIHFPDSLLVRPHPCIWRIVLAIALIYLAFLSFLLFQNLETVRTIVGLYDPSLLKKLPEGQYAEDCRISTSNNPYLFFQTAFDVFILAHSLGYFVKTLILRDWRVATCISIGFEIIEVTFQHVLPNFKECWWDHVLLDVLICNAGGTLLGILALRKLRAKEYHWVALRDIKDYRGKAKRILGQLGPRSFLFYEWNVFHSPKRFLQFAALLALVFIAELNCFTMKHILQMPTKYHLVIARLVMWSLIAMPSVREFYEYINTSYYKGKRFGSIAWVGVLALLLETILIIKLAIEGNYFQQPMPSYIAIPWMFAILLFVIWFIVFFGVISLEQRMKRQGLLYTFSTLLFYSTCFCILALFAMGMPDLQIGRATFERFFAPYESQIFFWR